MRLAIRWEDVWQRVGERSRLIELTDHLPIANSSNPSFGLLLAWSTEASYLVVEPLQGPPTRLTPLPLSREPAAIAEVCRRHGLDPRQLDPIRESEPLLLALTVPRGVPLQLRLSLDTDSPEFLVAAERSSPLTVVLDVLVFEAGHAKAGQIEVLIDPAAPVPEELGHVAMDLGNSASVIVRLPAGFGKSTDILVHNPPTPSVVRLEAVETAEGVELPRAYWQIGTSEGEAGVILGAKRLAASTRKTVRVFARPIDDHGVGKSRIETQVPADLPLELLATRLLQNFRRTTLTQPRELAVTYPTTYTRRERERVRQAVTRAWRRSVGSNLAGREDSVVGLMLDEASAAAFFFLAKDVLESPGGLVRFRYLHPQGLNLLLFDCGGGTTDVALVRAAAEPGGTRLKVRVLGRGGLRGFGGDNITATVCRLLKAKLAIAVLTLRGERNRPVFPARPDSDTLAKFLNDNATRFDAIIPTMFGPGTPESQYAERRRTALELAHWAEQLKIHLGRNPTALSVALSSLSFLNSPLANFLASTIPHASTVLPRLGEVTLERAELDCLLEEPVQQAVDLCNQLIRRRLTTEGHEVGWVVATGNGSRYPLIPKLLREGLAVAFLDEDGPVSRFTLDPENLKLAVAKGAALALALRRARRMVQIEFDGELSERLPHDVTYHDPRINEDVVLFAEYSRYVDLTPKLIDLESGDDDGRVRLELGERWPGEESATPTLRFEFSDRAKSPIRVQYDLNECAFRVFDAKNQEAERAELVDTRPGRVALELPPFARGDW